MPSPPAIAPRLLALTLALGGLALPGCVQALELPDDGPCSRSSSR